MFKGSSIWQIIQAGGFTMYILIFCSVLSLAIILERLIYYFFRSRIKRRKFMSDIKLQLDVGEPKKALEIAEHCVAPFARVVYAGLNQQSHNEKLISNVMEREIAVEITLLERYIGIVGTIGSTAVYIGLFGTVLGIMRAFQDISANASGGTNVVISGIAEALVCTATGLCVAIPAVVAYNYFVKRIDDFTTDMELCASEIIDLLAVKKK